MTRPSVLVLLVLFVAAACSSSGAGASSDTTLSPNVQPSAVTFTTVHDDATVPPGGPSSTAGQPGVTSDPEVRAFCEQVRASAADLESGPPDTGSGDSLDAAALERYQALFRDLAAQAPTSIKPEVTAMSNIIGQIHSAADLDILEQPEFMRQQDAVTAWVGENCGAADPNG